jgi:thiopurine S-methyltransferase
MDENFWLQKWDKNDIAFHEREANPTLVKYFKELSLGEASRVFVPLCGKTLDIAWLLAKGCRVAGAELSAKAIEELFLGLGVKPSISASNGVHWYSAENIDIFVGNIFNVTGQMLGSVDAVYDRAALVALPEDTRRRYAKHLIEITHQAPQLLLSFVYNQSLMEGPPFSVSSEEVNELYRDRYKLTLLASTNIPGGLKGCPAAEYVWLLKSKNR